MPSNSFIKNLIIGDNMHPWPSVTRFCDLPIYAWFYLVLLGLAWFYLVLLALATFSTVGRREGRGSSKTENLQINQS